MKEKKLTLNKLTLQIIAMSTMLVDHIGAFLLGDLFAMRLIGRLAFPIFAFFIAEGCERTRRFLRYIGRMALFAVLSEIPFDFVHGNWWDWGKQNVLWTFLLAMLCIYVWKKLANRRETVGGIFLSVLAAVAAFVLGELLHTDYGGFGVLVVLLFWVCREQPWRRGGELLGQAVIYWRTSVKELLKTGELIIPLQGFALLAVPLLWLYNGEQGKHTRMIQYACYAFYPVHLLILGLIVRTLR